MGYKVLLVEDDHDIREAVADYFTGVEASEMNIEDSKNVRDNLGRTFIEIIIKFSYIIQKYSYFFDVIGMIYFKM